MKVHIEQEINAPADEVWAILGKQFADIGNWFTGVKTSRPSSLEEVPNGYILLKNAPVTGRVTVSKAAKVTEILTYYSDEKREFIFDATDIPKFMISKSQNNSKVKFLSPNKSIVVINVEMKLTFLFKFLDGILKSRMTKMMKQLQTELKAYAETGKISKEKLIQLEKAAL